MKYLGAAFALLYNSWLLAYIFNPPVVRQGLMSALEAAHQPYNWLFISCDTICGILTLLIGWLYFKNRQSADRLVTLILIGLIVFGVLTAASALIPLNCGLEILICGYGAGQAFATHDLLSAVAALGLFVTMLIAVIKFKNQPWANWNLALLLLWSACGLWYLFAALINSPSGSLIRDVVTPTQQLFIALSGLEVWLICYYLGAGGESRTPVTSLEN